MSNARKIADLLDANGDVKSDHLDNVDGLPSRSGHSGKYLKVKADNSTTEWSALSSDFAGLTDTTTTGSDPLITSNKSVGHIWVNTSSGETYVCTIATTNLNVWKNIGDGSGTIEPNVPPVITGLKVDGTAIASYTWADVVTSSSNTYTISGATDPDGTDGNIDYSIINISNANLTASGGVNGADITLTVATIGSDINNITFNIRSTDEDGGTTDSAQQSIDLIAFTAYSIEYLVIAGGGGGGKSYGGGGGAGGYRTATGFTTSSTTYTIEVGSGGAGATSSSNGSNGEDSVFSTITSAGGGGGGTTTGGNGSNGGSGGGAGTGTTTAGSGNTPSTTPSQGYDGGYSTTNGGAAGGGGAGGVGVSHTSIDYGRAGGAPASSDILVSGTGVLRAGGGGGGGYWAGGSGGGGGAGDGGDLANSSQATPGSANTGSGGGGGPAGNGGSGGSGLVILRMLTSVYSGTTTGLSASDVTTNGSYTVLRYRGDGTYTAQEVNMAHYAKLGLNSKVVAVHSVNNDVITDADGNESEQLGIAFLHNLHNYPFWIQTSYNNNIRKNYAGIGFRYDDDLDAFIPPKPYSSWALNEDTCQWEAPTPMPEEGHYMWDEEVQDWVILEEQPIA